MNETRIDWCDSSHNPITGCLRGCEYCYARAHARRFGMEQADNDLHVLDEPFRWCGKINPYPFGFAPTFHQYRLDEPARKTKPQVIFWGSMADIFGPWVPEDWIMAILHAATKAPQHRHLFLTKYPMRLHKLAVEGKLPNLPNFWYGHTVTGQGGEIMLTARSRYNTFVSYEPMLAPMVLPAVRSDMLPAWFILGAESGSRKGKVIPPRAWAEDVAAYAHEHGAAVFMKESLRTIMGQDFEQAFPWEVRT